MDGQQQKKTTHGPDRRTQGGKGHRARRSLGGHTVRDALQRMLPEAASLGLTERRSFVVNAGGQARQVDATTTLDELERMFREGEELLVDLNVAARGGRSPREVRGA
jgi:hypothetical protein